MVVWNTKTYVPKSIVNMGLLQVFEFSCYNIRYHNNDAETIDFMKSGSYKTVSVNNILLVNSVFGIIFMNLDRTWYFSLISSENHNLFYN